MRPILRNSLFAGRHLSYEQHIRLGCDQGAQSFSNDRMILDAQNTNRLVRLHRSVSQGTGARKNAATFDASRHVPFILDLLLSRRSASPAWPANPEIICELNVATPRILWVQTYIFLQVAEMQSFEAGVLRRGRPKNWRSSPPEKYRACARLFDVSRRLDLVHPQCSQVFMPRRRREDNKGKAHGY